MTKPFDPRLVYAHLPDGGKAATIPLTEQFWDELVSGKRELTGRLVTAFTFTEPWPVWEMHPAGDELLILISGTAELALQEGEHGESRVRLDDDNRCVLIPKGVWHRLAGLDGPCEIVFVTPGEGTQHRSA